jgi:outer membrane lipoprotein-sorting protein
MRKIVLLVVIFVFSTVPALAQVTEILKRMDVHRKVLKSLRADLSVNKFSVQMGGIYRKEGVLTMVPQKNNNFIFIRVDAALPETENFLIVQNQYLVYLPDQKIAYTGTATDSQKNLFFLFSDFSEKELKSDHAISYAGQEKVGGTIQTWHLELIPKTPKSYQKIELWIDANGMPIQLKINETSGDWTNVLLSNLNKNVRLNMAELTIKLPKNTKVIKN